jgi:NADH-quinone oxidoreductase subunit E
MTVFLISTYLRLNNQRCGHVFRRAFLSCDTRRCLPSWLGFQEIRVARHPKRRRRRRKNHVSTATKKPETAPLKITPELRAFIDEWKDRPGNLIMVLHRVQQTFGFVPREVAFEVADLLHVPLAKIYGVITFYNFFKLKKPGRNQIQVCIGTACYLKGGEDIIKDIEQRLGVGLNAVTPDGEFSIEAVRCLGCCGLAPVMTVNGEVYGKVEMKNLPGILAKYRKTAA